MTIKKAYYYFYYKTYNFFINISDDALNSFKPAVLISALEVILVMDFFIWHTIVTKNDAALFPYVCIVIFIAVFNSYVFLHNNKYKTYYPEFENYRKKKKIIGGWIVFVIVLLIIDSLIFSFYQMSLIDWRPYR